MRHASAYVVLHASLPSSLPWLRPDAAARVLDAPDTASGVIRQIQLAIATLRDSHGAPSQLRRLSIGRDEAFDERLEVPRRTSVRHRLEHDSVALLRLWGAIPRAGKHHEDTIAIPGWQRAASVEEHAVRGPVAGERPDVALLAFAAAHRGAVAPVFGRKHLLLQLAIEVAVRPAKIGTPGDVQQFFGRRLGVLLGGEAPVFSQIVPTVL